MPRRLSYPRNRSGRILVAGAIAAHPIGGGGNTWAFLQYVLGLQRLGFEVFYFEELAPERCFDETWNPAPFETSYNAAYFRQVMTEFGLERHAGLWSSADPHCGIGLPFARAVNIARTADAIVNLSGRMHREEILFGPRRRIYVDLDPAFTQIWQERYGVDMNLRNHDVHFTVGLCFGSPQCKAPTCGVSWHPTTPPVVLDHWETSEIPGRHYTTVADWRGYSPVEWQGVWYGQKSEEFLRILDLPRFAPVELELCLAIHPEEPDLARLRAAGWLIADPRVHAGSPEAYRRYIHRSRGEFTVVKNGYRVGRTGWFSDRSACYLAAGRPAVVQDTGFSGVLPCGIGLLAFETQDQACAALAAVERDYARHSRAARELAREYFDSDRVLARLLEGAGV
ncbi:MAG: hypothetical protein KatS3mg077_2832 [Candidatus Binatia bacterium]|nr:MAG: hypothetical protein KatS3mg077_2832 [Candidatus Binatia bacterium]